MPTPDQPGLQAQNVYLIIVCIVPLVLLAIMAGAFRQRNLPGAKSLLLFNVMCLEVSVMYALLALTQSPELALVTARLRFLGLSLMPFSYALLVAEFVGSTGWINRKTVLALLSVPIITQLAVWNVFGENRFYGSWAFVHYSVIGGDIVTFTGWYWVFFIYTYVMVIAAAVALFRFARHDVSFRRKQALVMSVGVIVRRSDAWHSTGNAAGLYYRISGIRQKSGLVGDGSAAN